MQARTGTVKSQQGSDECSGGLLAVLPERTGSQKLQESEISDNQRESCDEPETWHRERKQDQETGADDDPERIHEREVFDLEKTEAGSFCT